MTKRAPVSVVLPVTGELSAARTNLRLLAEDAAQPAEILLVTDAARGVVSGLADEVVITQGWIEAWWQALSRRGRLAVLRGPVRAELRGPEPAWLFEETGMLLHWLGLYDGGPVDRQLGPGWVHAHAPPLHNTLLRREAFGSMRFHALGEQDGWPALALEELPLLEALRDEGWNALYVAGAAAVVPVARERLVPRWFVERAFVEGRAMVRMVGAGDGAEAARLYRYGREKADDLLDVMRALGAAGVDFSRLPLRSRVDVATAMGIVMEIELQLSCDYLRASTDLQLHVLEGDVPPVFIEHLHRLRGDVPSVGAA